jgi:Bax protein
MQIQFQKIKINILIYLLIVISLTKHVRGQEKDEQQAFIDKLLPLIEEVNSEISKQRNGIFDIYQQFKTSQTLTPEEKQMIFNYLKFYRCKVPNDLEHFQPTDSDFVSLLKKVDIVPRKLVLAQAAVESDWGKSRFAKEGNSYFGIRCNTAGCGMAPKKVSDNSFYVKSYPSPIDGVRDYMRLLNSSRYYKDFRELRIVNRLNSELPDPLYVVNGLTNYSIKGREYIKSLVRIMKLNFYHL